MYRSKICSVVAILFLTVSILLLFFGQCSYCCMVCTSKSKHSFALFWSRLINPVVVAPTVAAVGLSFYSYGFPQVGTCLEIGAVQILLVVIFSLVSFPQVLVYIFSHIM